MKLATAALVGVLVGVAACSSGRAAAVDGCALDEVERGPQLRRTIRVGDLERSYILEVPSAVTPGKPVALLFAFHGWGHSSEGLWRAARFREMRMEQPVITVFPQGQPVVLIGNESHDGWEIKSLEGNRDVAFTAAMIDDIEKHYCIDPKRIFVSGFSNGAYLSHLLACALGDRIAAIAPVGGGGLLVPCEPKRAVPVIIHHGTSDRVVPIASARAARDWWAKQNRCGEAAQQGNCWTYADCHDDAEIVYCEEAVAHTWPAPATQRVWEFLQRHPME